MIHPALLVGSLQEIQCQRGHRTWLPLEDSKLVCACAAPAVRTGRTMLGAVGQELCGINSSPKLPVGMPEPYRLHIDIPELGKFRLD